MEYSNCVSQFTSMCVMAATKKGTRSLSYPSVFPKQTWSHVFLSDLLWAWRKVHVLRQKGQLWTHLWLLLRLDLTTLTLLLEYSPSQNALRILQDRLSGSQEALGTQHVWFSSRLSISLFNPWVHIWWVKVLKVEFEFWYLYSNWRLLPMSYHHCLVGGGHLWGLLFEHSFSRVLMN